MSKKDSTKLLFLWGQKLSLFWANLLHVGHCHSDPMCFGMRGSHSLLPHLEAICQEIPSCSLLTNDGGKLQVL